MKGKKVPILFLALLLPVVIFLFLKIFGKNEFQVPVFHEQGVIQAPSNCDFVYRTPYRIADSTMTRLNVNNSDSLFVFYFDPSDKSAMDRLTVEFQNDPLRVLSGADLPHTVDPAFFRECVLLMERETSVALVDRRNRIRGYYSGSDRDDVDRLIAEIKIILKLY